jgi:type IV secretory pathway TraG/TraD family ATPase VirD4
MAQQQWGRNEKILWPPQVPVYTIGAMVLSLPVAIILLVSLYMGKPLLERASTMVYLKSAVGSLYNGHGKYRLMYLSGGKHAARPAQSVDILPASDEQPGVLLSPLAAAQGYTTFGRGPLLRYEDLRLHNWLQAAVFGGHSLLGCYWLALAEWSAIVLPMLGFAFYFDFKRSAELKYGRLLRGPVMLEPKAFNRRLKSEGIGVQTTRKGTVLRLPLTSEAKHMQIMGDTGSGKSQLLMQLLDQIEGRGETAIVYDSAGEFTQRYYRAERGDIILNPMDARCPYWDPSSELRTPAEAQTIAVSLYQPPDDKQDDFFARTPQKIFAHLLKYRPTPQQLIEWMSNEEEIDKRLANTPLASVIQKTSPDQRNGVLGSLAMIADSLRLLPSKEQAAERFKPAQDAKEDAKEKDTPELAEAREKKSAWSATGWAEKRTGWIFFTSTEAEQDSIRPMQSLWIDLLVLRLLPLPKEGQKRAWFVLDELASLQRLPQLHTALTKGRKSNNPIIFGYQGKAQLEVLYGHLAEVMLSQPATKIILKTAEPEAAKWASELIGEIEIERVRETVADGKRAGKSFAMDRQIEPLVMRSEIQGLNDLHAFLKLGNYVTRFSFPYIERKEIAEGMVKRVAEEEHMWLEITEPGTATATEAGTTAGPGTGPGTGMEPGRTAPAQTVQQAEKPESSLKLAIVPHGAEKAEAPLPRPSLFGRRSPRKPTQTPNW